MIILEARRGEQTEALTLLQRQGYEIEERTRMNVVLTKASSDGVHSANGNHVKT